VIYEIKLNAYNSKKGFGAMSNDNWKEDVEINPDALDVEWCRQSSLFAKYCEKQVTARDTVDRLKHQLDVLEAELGLKIRNDPASYGLEKVTEAGVQSVMLLNKKRAALHESLLQARYELEIVQSAVRALDQKKSALENLVRLGGQNYFAMPSVPRDLGQEWTRQTERGLARSTIKRSLSRKER